MQRFFHSGAPDDRNGSDDGSVVRGMRVRHNVPRLSESSDLTSLQCYNSAGFFPQVNLSISTATCTVSAHACGTRTICMMHETREENRVTYGYTTRRTWLE